ncbi:MAG: type II secretion system F family protein [Planctomycetaceae bacterium]
MEYLSPYLPWLVFGCISLGLVAIFAAFSRSKTRTDERLDELRDPRLRNQHQAGNDDSGNGVGKMFEKAAPALSKALKPKSELEESALKVRLANAGFNSPNAAQIFLAIKVALLMGGAVIGLGVGISVWGMNQKGLTAMVVGGGFGFYLSEIGLWWLRKARIEKIFLSMPDALDLLVVCVEAGLGLDAGMRRVAEELSDSAPELCQEFDLANLQLQMGRPRREVLHDLGVRSGVDDMRTLVAVLIQADKFGSSIAKALRVQSDSMRVKRKQMAEEKAQQTAVKMIFPLVLFIFPGIFVVLVGPAAIMMIKNGMAG